MASLAEVSERTGYCVLTSIVPQKEEEGAGEHK